MRVVADLNLARQLATSIVETLKRDGHILIAKGKGEALLRELIEHIQPTLALVMPRILRSEVHGEVTSTFGDEATDEAIEALVENLRELLIDSEGVEDVFAEDKIIERVIFRTLSSELVSVAHTTDGGDDEEEKPPISVRLGTLGYVAATAAKLSDQETLRDALERAALSASTVLDTFDAESRTAIFAAREDDPDKRLEIEEAVEEELSDLVDMGIVDLPRIERTVPLPAPLADAEKKALGKSVAAVADKTLTSRVCPAVWEWQGNDAIKLSFTPHSEPDAKIVGELATNFARELEAMLAEGPADRSAPRGGERVKERAAIDAILRAAAATAPPSSRRGTSKDKSESAPISSKRAPARVEPPPASSKRAPAAPKSVKGAAAPPSSRGQATPPSTKKVPAPPSSRGASAPPSSRGPASKPAAKKSVAKAAAAPKSKPTPKRAAAKPAAKSAKAVAKATAKAKPAAKKSARATAKR